MKADLYNLKNKTVGEISLPDRIFGAHWNPELVRQVSMAQMANRRRPWAHAKDRSEVSGGGRKPWRQKGTGRARHGSIRSPLWIGGGKAHGPNKERDYSQKVNKKMLQGALFSVLSKKLKDGELRFFDSLAIELPKTKILSGILRELTSAKKRARKLDVLMIPDLENKKLFRAAANIQKTKVLSPKSLNVYDLLNYKNIFIDKEAVLVVEGCYTKLTKK